MSIPVEDLRPDPPRPFDAQKSFIVPACLADSKVFRQAGFFTTINGTMQIVVWNRNGGKILKWAPLQKWVWFYGSHSSDGEHLTRGKGIKHLLKHLDEFRQRQLLD